MMTNFVRYAFTVWLIIITLIYVYSSLNWLKNPFNKSPYDYLFFLIVGACMVLPVIASISLRAKGYVIPALLGFIAMLLMLTTSLLSKTIVEIAVFLWISLLAWLIGRKVFRMICINQPIIFIEEGILSIAIGYGFYSFVMFGLGASGFLYREVVTSVMVALSILLAKDGYALLREAFTECKNLHTLIKDTKDIGFLSALASIIITSFILNFIGAIAPEIQYDSLNYHLTVPKIYIENHSIVNLPHIMQSYFAKSIEMLYALSLILSGQNTAKLFSLSFGVSIIIGIIAFGKRFFSFEAGIIAAALFYVSPLVGWLSTTTYIDLAVTFYIFSAIYSLVLWWKMNNKGLLLICGLMAGLALSAKLNAALALVPVSLSVVVISYHLSGKSLYRNLSHWALFGIPIILVATPWYLTNYFHTGNPVFPFYNALFKSPLLPYENTFMNLKDFGMGYGLKDFFLLPWNITYHTKAFIEATPDGILGITFLIVLPFVFLVFRRRFSGILILMISICMLFIGIWFIIGQYARYLLPILPVVALLSGYVLLQFSDGQSRFFTNIRNMTIIVGLSATIPIYLVYFWNIPERIPFKFVFGLESKEQYLERVIRTYQASSYLNKHYDQKKIKVLLIGTGFRFYLNAIGENPITSLNTKGFFNIKTPEELLRYLKSKHFTHILIDTFAAPIISGSVLEIVNEQFLAKHAQLEFISPHATLYKITEKRVDKHEKIQQQLLTNPRFERGKEEIPYGWYKFGNPLFDSSSKKSRFQKGAIRTSKDDFFMQNVDIKEYNLYTLSHCTSAEKDNQFARLQINWLASDGKIIRPDIKIVPVLKEKWACNSMSVNAPEGAKTAVIYASVHEDSEVWFDDFSFIEGVK